MLDGCSLAALLSALAAPAQVLDLGGPLEPPQLDRFTWPVAVAGRLESEMAELRGAREGAAPVEQVVADGKFNLRVIAADLLGSGDEAGPAGCGAVLRGATLAEGRHEIDRALEGLIEMSRRIQAAQGRVDERTERRFRAGLGALRQFNEDAERLAASVQTTSDRDLDRAVPAILAALGEAVAEIGGAELVDHWPRRDEARANGAGSTGDGSASPPPPPRPVRTLEEIARDIPGAAVGPDTQEELLRIVDFLERGEQFARHRPYVLEYRRLLSQVIDLAQALARATWLDEETRGTYHEHLHKGVMLFSDKRTRERGQRYLDRLESSRVMIERLSALETATRGDLGGVKDAFLAADDMIDNAAEAEQGEEQLRQLMGVVERMTHYRELGEVKLHRDLRALERQLDRRYRDAEERLLKALPSIIARPGALADPAMSTLLTDHLFALQDLKRVRDVPAWVDAVKLIDRQAGQHFHAQARKMCTWLLEPARRPDAILAMDQFEQQLDLFYPLPFEAELRSGDVIAAQATGGQHEAYAKLIDAERITWAQAWGDGNAASPAAQRMLLLYRLSRTMLDLATVLRLGGDGAMLNLWAAWQLDGPALGRAVEGLPSRVRLAVALAIERNDEALGRQLDQIDKDAPFAKLIGRLCESLRSWLAEAPTARPRPSASSSSPRRPTPGW